MTAPAQQSSEAGLSLDSSVAGNGRLPRITAKLLDVLYALSGTEIEASDADKTFFELGMDSLLLTQAASTAKRHLSASMAAVDVASSGTIIPNSSPP